VATGDYQKIVFLGDYVDPYDDEHIADDAVVDGLTDIIALKQHNPDKVVLLLGNHDLHYYSEYYNELVCSDRYTPDLVDTLKDLYTANSHLFQLAYETHLDGRHYLFSHAGVTQSWLNRNIDTIKKPDVSHLNHLLLTNKGIETLAQVGILRWGEHTTGSIVWADSAELKLSPFRKDTYQIVGHTMQFYGPIINNKFACLDCQTAFTLNEHGGIKPFDMINI